MRSPSPRRLSLWAVVAVSSGLLLLASMKAAAPDSAPNGARLTKFIMGVADLDRMYAFYRALGIDLDGAATLQKPTPLPEFLLKLVDVPAGTKFRNAMLKIPGADFALEATEFSNMPLRPGRPRLQDPGAAVLILAVRDIGAALTAAKKAGGEVVSVGGTPLTFSIGNTSLAVCVKDPDGFYIELVQPNPSPASTVPAGINVIGGRFGSVVKDAEKAAQFYRDKFGLEAEVADWTSDSMQLKLFGLQRGQLRNARIRVIGSGLAWSFVQFKDIDAKPVGLRIPDPGAPAIGFEVRDLSAAVAAIKSSGGSVVTTGNGRIETPTGDAIAFTRDPNGILVELAQTAAAKR
jgi:catechol 2,3-dioxygenase-like lactoylglutathione lyase family enzyme